jgi:hypothetical protein
MEQAGADYRYLAAVSTNGTVGMVPTMRDVQRPHQYSMVFLSPRLARREEIMARAARLLRPVRPAAADSTSG